METTPTRFIDFGSGTGKIVKGGEVLQAKTLALIGWLETLITPQGDRAGQPFELLEWERRLLNGVIDSDVSTAAMSLGRGNGKTTFSAALGAAGIMGPLAQPNAEVTLMASAFGQARIGFAHAKAFLTPWIESEPRRFSITDTSQRATIVDRHTGSSLIARGSDPRRAHGLAPVLALLDEPAQWPPSTANAMVAALTTADGKIPDALFIALGTRPADSGHWFQQWLNGGADYSQIHAATDKMPLYQRKTWLRANSGPGRYAAPGTGHTPTRWPCKTLRLRAAIIQGVAPEYGHDRHRSV